MNRHDIGRMLSCWRHDAGYSQEQVASKMNWPLGRLRCLEGGWMNHPLALEDCARLAFAIRRPIEEMQHLLHYDYPKPTESEREAKRQHDSQRMRRKWSRGGTSGDET